MQNNYGQTKFRRIATVGAIVLLLVTLLSLAGCAAKAQKIELETPKHTAAMHLKESTVYAGNIYDPLEWMNRRTYSFNYYFDKYLFLPIVNGYEFITPDYLEDRISCFIDNVYEFNNFTNNLLQLKFKNSGIVVGRFVVNSTVGILGLWDPATGFGMEKQPEDFAQTLGSYGVGAGPYLVLPILGPSNLRGATGFVTDAVLFSVVGPASWIDDDATANVFTGVAAVNSRYRTKFRYYSTGSPFEYDMVRMLYSKKQEFDIAK